MAPYCQNTTASVLEIAMHNVSRSRAFGPDFTIAQSRAIYASNKLDSASLWLYLMAYYVANIDVKIIAQFLTATGQRKNI